MSRCKRAYDLVEYALSYGWTAEATYGDDEGDEHCTVSVTWSDVDGWAIGCILRWYRDEKRKTWRLAELDGGGCDPIGGVAEWIPTGRSYEFSLRSLKLLRSYIGDRAPLIAWLDEERMRHTQAQQHLLSLTAKALAEQSR